MDTTETPQEAPVSAPAESEADAQDIPAAAPAETASSAVPEPSPCESGAETDASPTANPAEPNTETDASPAANPAEPGTETDASPAADPAEPDAETDASPAATLAESGAETEAVPAAKEKAKAIRHGILTFLGDAGDLAESVAAAVFVVLLVFTFLLCTANVEGDSMVPTLENGDRLLVSRIGRHYETGDILILNSESAYLFDADGKLTASPGLGKEIVKRLIAQAGQEINIDFDEGIVYVDGKALDEPYTSTLTKRDNRAFTYPMTVPEGYVFVLGDNRHISKDSRHPEIGLIPAEKIVGKVLIRIMPPDKIGRIDSSGGQQAESQRD